MKRILFSLFIIAELVTANANVITAEQAQAIAVKFMTTSMHKQVETAELALATRGAKKVAGVTQSAPAYYVFNASQSYVIVAGDDRMPAVLGYSDSGTIDPNDMPDGLKELLESYALQAACLTSDSDGLPVPSGSISRSPIAPLLTSKWDQGAPFNLSCPLIDNSKRAVTGCTATAMAQVMDYWKWPATISQPIPAYISFSKYINMPELSVEGFPGWDNVKDYYWSNDNSTSGIDVSKIMLYCGQALHTDYKISSSSASFFSIPFALSEYFRYAPSVNYSLRSEHTAEEWATLIYTELEAKRPVVYSGRAYNGSGHAFVCDGIDANGLFHINWGWGGYGDGYFLLSILDSKEQGDGNLSNGGYFDCQVMVTGIIPEFETISVNNAPMYCQIPLENKHEIAVYTRSSTNQSFSNVMLNCAILRRDYSTKIDVDFGIGLYDTIGILKQIAFSTTAYDNSLDYTDWYCSISSSIPDGTYILKPICRLHNSSSWMPCEGASTNYWKATINSTTLKIETIGNSATPSYQVNSVNYNGKMEKYRTIEMVANITNTGTNYLRTFKLYVDDTYASAAQCAIEPGQTGDINVRFSSKTIGNHSIKLCCDNLGTQILWSDSVYINSPTNYSVSANQFTINNATSENKINNDKFAFSVKVTNNSALNYEDHIVASLFRRSNANYGSMQTSIVKDASIMGNGGSQILSFEFPNLVKNEDYFILMNYYKDGRLAGCGSTNFYTILGSDFKTGDVNGDGKIDVADINILIDIILNLDDASKYSGRADVNGDTKVDVADINQIIDMIL